MTRYCVMAERAMNRKLQGGCQVPIGAYAVMEDDHIWLRGLVGALDGQQIIRGDVSGPKEQAEALGELLTGLVHQKISRYLTREVLSLTADYPAHKLTMSQIQRLAHGMKHDSYAIKKTRDFSYAQVTAGGLASRDFNPETLESRLQPGLYAAGEVLDIDGDCGGYNLQWAWSSGRLAGQQAALSILQREHQHA